LSTFVQELSIVKSAISISIALAAALLGACASNSGVVRMGNDTYLISKKAADGFTGLGKLRSEAMHDAYAQCSKVGKSVEVIKTDRSRPPFISGNFPRVDITFRCVTK
jgi:uncharacterized low-complexity protein